MLFRARRVLADLRRMWGWILVAAVVSFVVAAATMYSLLFAASSADLLGLTDPPATPVSHIRAVGPDESIISVDTAARRDVFEEPGMRALLDVMTEDQRIYIALPLETLLTGPDRSAPPTSALAIINPAPAVLGVSPDHDEVLVWGTMSDAGGQEDDGLSVAGLPAQQMSRGPITNNYVNGRGRVASTGPSPTVALGTSAARMLGVSEPTSSAEVAAQVTCYCSTSELAGVAAEMTRAEAERGSRRAYYAVANDQTIGPLERSGALTETYTASQPIVALVGLSCVAAGLGRLFLRRRGAAFEIEHAWGIPRWFLHARAQLVLAMSFTLPSVGGLALVHATTEPGAFPPPLPRSALAMLSGALLALHLLAGWPLIRSVRTAGGDTRRSLDHADPKESAS